MQGLDISTFASGAPHREVNQQVEHQQQQQQQTVRMGGPA
jgi:hypothetical protein